jgi:hypothetical protein
MEMLPAAALAIILGMTNALTRPGPLAFIVVTPSVNSSMPPMPVPRITPARNGSSLPASSPLSAMASRAATMANWVNRSSRRSSRGSTMPVGSNCFTSPANFTLKSAVSNRVIGPMPLRPASNPFQ